MRLPNTPTLHGLFHDWIVNYSSVLENVKATGNFKHPFRELISKQIPAFLEESLSLTNQYKVVGSYGKGRWTSVPWIAIFDTQITTSAQKGVYIVYLLNKDTQELYLTLEAAATEVMDTPVTSDGKKVFTGVVGKTNPVFIDKIENRVHEIRSHLSDSYFNSNSRINTGSDGYDHGTIYYKRYTAESLPDDAELLSDLQRMMVLYQRYASIYIGGKKDMTTEPPISSSPSMSTREIISKIEEYISAQGFSYEDGTIENFFLSLKSKPFVILAGTSGTGKTRLVRLFAEAVGATKANGRYKMVPVRPDWSDSSDLFGHVDLNGKFIPGAITDFIHQAAQDTDKPYFLCLDEMNLARVEYYLSDILSIIETRDFKDGSIVSDLLIDLSYYGSDSAAAEKYGKLSLPENLYLIGTVNMDETTFPFSRKVLDRANTIEFSFVDLIPHLQPISTISSLSLDLPNSFLKSEYLLLAQCADKWSDVNEYCVELQEINQILQKGNSHIGYRVRDEIIFYLLNNISSQLLSSEEAMDNEIMQKILPRIQGSSISIKEMLCALFKVCVGDYKGLQTDGGDTLSKMEKAAASANCRYKKSAAKIAFMVRRYEEDGFTSFWF